MWNFRMPIVKTNFCLAKRMKWLNPPLPCLLFYSHSPHHICSWITIHTFHTHLPTPQLTDKIRFIHANKAESFVFLKENYCSLQDRDTRTNELHTDNNSDFRSDIEWDIYSLNTLPFQVSSKEEVKDHRKGSQAVLYVNFFPFSSHH